MNILLRTVLIASVAFPAGPLHAADQADQRPVRIRQAHGAVDIRKAGHKEWTKARPGQILFPGTQVKTGPDSRAQLMTPLNDRVQLSARTTVELAESTSRRSTIQVLVGRMRSIVMRVRRRPTYEVKTPLAVASVRGTEFDTIVDEDGRSTFEVRKGIVSVRDLGGLGEEVSVFKGQKTTVERGTPPTAPSEIGKEIRGRLQERGEQKEKALARLEARREIGIQAFKDHLQTDVTREQRISEYQAGKTVIDAFGRRVRIEEYIVRPDPSQFSFVTINTRDKSVTISRYDAWAASPLPPKLNDVKFLFRKPGNGTGTDTPLNNIVKQRWYVSNGGDIYREFSEGGTMVYFSDINFWQVVFSNWYVELKGRDQANYRLVSHWVPEAAFLSGASSNTSLEDITVDGVLDLPNGYADYKNGGLLGDDRGIDTVSFDNRRRDADIFANATYQASEGYERQSSALFDGVPFATIPLDRKIGAILNAREVSAVHKYLDTDGSTVVTQLRTDQFNVDDLGRRLSLTDRQTRRLDLGSINFERVANSPDYAEPIDVILTPRIFKDAGIISAN